VSGELVDLLKQLLQKDIKNRMDPKEIPNHPWFKNIDFGLVKAQKLDPPFVPTTTNKLDFGNIDKCFLKEEIPSALQECNDMNDEEFYDDIFREF